MRRANLQRSEQKANQLRLYEQSCLIQDWAVDQSPASFPLEIGSREKTSYQLSILRIAGSVRLVAQETHMSDTGKHPCVVLGPPRDPARIQGDQGRPPAPGGPERPCSAALLLPCPCHHSSSALRAMEGAQAGEMCPGSRAPLDTGDVVLPVEVGLHVARAAVVAVQRLHGCMRRP